MTKQLHDRRPTTNTNWRINLMSTRKHHGAWKQRRRDGALQRLTYSLHDPRVELTPRDRARIEAEIAILEQRGAVERTP